MDDKYYLPCYFKILDTVEWNVNDLCRAPYTDGNEYECKIESITTDESGDKFASVTYIEYGNTETLWLKDLKPSTGEPTTIAKPVDVNSNVVEALPVVAGNEPSTLNEASGQSSALESESIPAKKAPKWKHGTYLYYLNSVSLCQFFCLICQNRCLLGLMICLKDLL